MKERQRPVDEERQRPVEGETTTPGGGKKMMMTRLVGLVLLTVLLAALAVAAQGAGMNPPPIVVSGVGLNTPESVLYDRRADMYLIANINGAPTGIDNNGFISVVTPGGRVRALKWIAGGERGVTLNAPKGMAILGETLYVADITAVRMFDRRTGRAKGSHRIAGTTFLNDVASGNGSIYVTDSGLRADFSPSGTDGVYRITPGGSVRRIARGAALKGPNGVTVLPDGRVFIVTFSQTGETYTLGPGGQPQDVRRMPAGQLDGVEVVRGGALLISSWATSTVYRVDRAGMAKPLVEKVPSPADIGYDSRRNRVLIPIFSQHRLVIQPLR